MTDLLAQEQAEIAELEKQQQTAPESKALEPEVKEPEAEAPAPEGEGEAETEETVELDNKGRFVRHGAFHAEREQRKQWQQKANELEARYAADMAKVTERLAAIAQARQEQPAPKQQVIELPNKDHDPIGYFEAKTAQLEAKLAEAETWRQGEAKKTEEQTKLERIGAEVSRLEAEYAKTVTDYPDAQRYLQDMWTKEAQLLGATREQAIKFYATQIVQAAAQQNKNPAEIAYEYAKARGYTKAAPKAGPNLETIAKGIEKSKTPTNAAGKAPAGVLTAEALAQMSDDEFNAKFGGRDNRTWEKEMRRVFGAN